MAEDDFCGHPFYGYEETVANLSVIYMFMFSLKSFLIIIILLIPFTSSATLLDSSENYKELATQYSQEGLDRKVLEGKITYKNGSQKKLLYQQDFQKENGGKLSDKESTFYIVNYDFELAENIIIPANSILCFDGGSIRSGGKNRNTIIGKNTFIQAGLYKIFDENIVLSGTWKNVDWKLDWFVNIENGIDITNAVQSCLEKPAINFIEIPGGWYLLTKTIVVPANKTLKMQGHRKRYMMDATDVELSETRIISSGIKNGFMFDIRSKASVIGGAIIPGKDMTNGGAFLLDIGKYRLSSIYLNTDICIADTKNYLSNNLTAIFIDGNYKSGGDKLPCGENFTFDVNITGFKNGIYLERLNESESPQLVWFNNYSVSGWMAKCQWYMFSNCNTENHAGGSGKMCFNVQGAKVNDANIPAIEWGGEQNVFDVTFHDVGPNQSQKIRYKVKGNHCYYRRQKCDASVILTNYGLWNTFEEGPIVQKLEALAPGCSKSIQFLSGYIEHSGHSHSVFLRCRINGAYKRELLLRLPHTSGSAVYADCFAESSHCICFIDGNGLYFEGTAYNSLLNVRIDYIDSVL